MGPGEGRWVGFTFQVEKGKEGQLLPVTFHEMADGKVVNGFTIVGHLSPVEEVILDNINLHVIELGRIAATPKFNKIPGAAEERKAALTLLISLRKRGRDIVRGRGRKPSESQQALYKEYIEFVRSHSRLWEKIASELVASQRAGDPFSVLSAVKHLASAAESGDIDLISLTASAHTRFLYKLDPFLTMLQRQPRA